MIQEKQLGPKDFIKLVKECENPHSALLEWGRRRNTGTLSRVTQVEIDAMPTLIETPVAPITPVSPRMCDTDELVATILNIPRDMSIEIADSAAHTIDLIHEGVYELEKRGYMPRTIVLSHLRYMALGDLILQLKYYYHGMHVPFGTEPGGFDVRIYGSIRPLT